MQLEYQIIGSFIKDTGTQIFIERLNKEDFLDEKCKALFNTMLQLKKRRQDITLSQLQSKTGVKVSEIIDITNTVATTLSIDSDVKLLKDRSNRRLLKQKAHLILKMADDETKEISEIKNDALREIQELEEVTNEEIVTLSEAMFETAELLEKRYKNKDDKGYYTGISSIDKFMGGLHRQELTTIGARPGVGKTMLGMQIALRVSTNGKKVMFTSLEMSVTQVCERIIASNTDIDSIRLRTGNIKDDEWAEIIRVVSLYENADFILDKTSRTVQHIRAKVRKYKPEMVIIDYLQLLQSGTREQSREREVATMARDLKLMSLEFNIPVIMLSQLRRDAESRVPNMSDLRESGAIEQDSDNILFLHEPEDRELDLVIEEKGYSNQFVKSLEENNQKISQLIISKQRNGPVGAINFVKVPKLMKFIEIDTIN